MANFLTYLESLATYWAYGVALAGFAAAGWATIRLFGARVVYIYRAAGAVRNKYGDDAEAVVDYWYTRQKTIAIQEVRQRLLESNIGVSVFVCDSKGACEYVNEELAELFGLDRSECIGFGWLEGVAQGDRKRVHEHWMFCVANAIPYEVEYVCISQRTKAHVPVLAKGYPVKTPNAEVLCYVGTVTKVPPANDT